MNLQCYLPFFFFLIQFSNIYTHGVIILEGPLWSILSCINRQSTSFTKLNRIFEFIWSQLHQTKTIKKWKIQCTGQSFRIWHSFSIFSCMLFYQFFRSISISLTCSHTRGLNFLETTTGPTEENLISCYVYCAITNIISSKYSNFKRCKLPISISLCWIGLDIMVEIDIDLITYKKMIQCGILKSYIGIWKHKCLINFSCGLSPKKVG